MAMTMTGEVTLHADRNTVWEKLNDPEALKAAIPGCQDLEKIGDTAFRATVKLKVGPVGAVFKGSVELTDIDPPNGYRISGEGSGGVAGFAKGGAAVRLEAESADVTVLHYDVDAQIGGKLAQLGGRLIDSTAKKLAGEFFTSFAAVVGEPSVTAQAATSKTGWIAKLTGTAGIAGLVLLAGANWCCLTGQHHAPDALLNAAICSSQI